MSRSLKIPGFHDRIYSPSQSDDKEEDAVVTRRVQFLKNHHVALHHLGVPEKQHLPFHLSTLVQDTSIYFDRLNKQRLPRQKLKTMTKICNHVMQALSTLTSQPIVQLPSPLQPPHLSSSLILPGTSDETTPSLVRSTSASALSAHTEAADHDPLANPWGTLSPTQQAASASADMMLPLLIYLLTYGPIIDMVSQMRYIHRFRRQRALRGETNYCFTMIVIFFYFFFQRKLCFYETLINI